MGQFWTPIPAKGGSLLHAVLQIPGFQSPSDDIDWGRCCRILIKEFGPNGEKAAFELTRTGVQDGYYGVLKKVAQQMVDEYSGNEISAKIGFFWNNLNVKEKMGVIDEYLKKYGHLLPSELTEGSAARIKMNFIKVLEEHPRMIKRLRKVPINSTS